MIRKNFACFIITYNRRKILFETLLTLNEQSVRPSKILIVDNGDDPALRPALQTLGDPRIAYFEVGENSGPSGGAYHGLRLLTKQGYRWIQWIDDDDPPRLKNLNERLFEHLSKFPEDDIGVIAPVGAKFDRRRGHLIRFPNKALEENDYLYADKVGGNQGMIVNAAVIKSGCLPNKEFFFGFEDLNFCLKVRNEGYKILIPSELFMAYRKDAGRWDYQIDKVQNLTQKTPSTIWREYYSYRNLIYMLLYEFQLFRAAAMTIIRAIFKAASSFNKGFAFGALMTRYMIRAIWDGVLKRQGLLILPKRKY